MQTANASASIRVKKRFLVFMEILLNCSGLWYPSCIGLAVGRICSASVRRCLSLGCGGVLWNKLHHTTKLSHSPRFGSISRVLCSKRLVLPKKQGCTQPRTALFKNFDVCFLQSHRFYDLQKQTCPRKPVFVIAVVVQCLTPAISPQQRTFAPLPDVLSKALPRSRHKSARRWTRRTAPT